VPAGAASTTSPIQVARPQVDPCLRGPGVDPGWIVERMRAGAGTSIRAGSRV
jgi:hypothetical protein